MRKVRPLFELRAPIADSDAVTIEYGGQTVHALAGEPLSSALLRAGILATTRSPKYRRPRGPYCLRGECGSCQVRIDGEPNIRACTTPVRDGLKVEAQNQWGPAGLDPTPIVDSLFRDGIDHHHLVVRPRLANAAMQRVARTMTGFGVLPDRASTAPATSHEHRPQALVVGSGSAGRAAACALERAGIDTLTIDRLDRTTLETSPGALPAGLLCGVGVFAAYPQEGLWAAAAAPFTGAGELALHIIRPQHVILAVGGREPMLPIANNDLPGVVSARGLVHLLRRGEVRAAAPVIVIGDGDHAEALAHELGAQRFACDEVLRITGGDAVDGVELADRRVPCRLVALAPTPAPVHELAAQAGGRLRFDGHGFAVVTDDVGRVESSEEGAREVPWTLWACGDIRGWRGPAASRADGEATAEAIRTAIGTALRTAIRAELERAPPVGAER